MARPDGIYFGLSDEDYHMDPALGSTDIRNLLRSAPDYWFESNLNPSKVFDEDITPARLRGKAMHALVLEGKDAFASRFVRRPDDPPGSTPADKGNLTKAAKRDLCGNGESLLHGDVYDAVLQSSVMVKRHPDLATAFTGGFSEVSVFWTRTQPDGIRCKCRFDYLKPRGFGDLKSITNTLGIDFRQACHNALAYNGYLLQGSHYLEGRAQLRGLFEDDAVFGLDKAPEKSDDLERWELLKKIAETKPTGMVWVFYQAEGAPLVYGKAMSFDNPIVSYERERIEVAFRRYREWMQKFGPNQIWLLDEPVTELDESELPIRYGQK